MAWKAHPKIKNAGKTRMSEIRGRRRPASQARGEGKEMSGGNQLEKGNQQADRRRKARAGQQKEQTVGGASLWQNQSPPVASRPALKGERRTETAVIGGGMAGVLAAWLLKEAGKKVILLEAAELASGQTGKTTAKITSQHGLIYDRLLTGAGGRPLRPSGLIRRSLRQRGSTAAFSACRPIYTPGKSRRFCGPRPRRPRN